MPGRNPTPLFEEVFHIFSAFIIHSGIIHIFKPVTEFYYYGLYRGLIHCSIMGYCFYNISEGDKLAHLRVFKGNPVVHVPEEVYSKAYEIIGAVYRYRTPPGHPHNWV